jgi:hypothetical protein
MATYLTRCTAVGGFIFLWLSGSVPASAAVSDSEFAELRGQLEALASRLSALEAENAALKRANEETIEEVRVTREEVASVGKSSSAASWAERIKIKGDFRYRVENIDEEGRDDRDRNRVRARAAIIARLPDDVELGLGMASGGDDPVSTNQTLGGGGSTKDLRLDLAYFSWSAMEDLKVVGGKYKNLNFRPGKYSLLWDGDFNPEGFGFKYAGEHLFGNFSGTWLESDSRRGNDEFAWSAQLGWVAKVAETRLTLGGGYHHIETKGETVFFGDDDDFFGNSFECTDPEDTSSCEYVYDYEALELFAEASTSVMDMPLTLFANYISNDDADDNDTGWAAGVKLGKASARGSWELSYAYQDLEADAWLGLISDSDFGGGGTDTRGHVLKGAIAVHKQWTLGFTYFSNEIGKDAGNERDYDRLMLDAQFKY